MQFVKGQGRLQEQILRSCGNASTAGVDVDFAVPTVCGYTSERSQFDAVMTAKEIGCCIVIV